MIIVSLFYRYHYFPFLFLFLFLHDFKLKSQYKMYVKYRVFNTIYSTLFIVKLRNEQENDKISKEKVLFSIFKLVNVTCDKMTTFSYL